MTVPRGLALSETTFADLQSEVQIHLDTSVRFPDWPFLAPTGFVTIYEYDRVLGGNFGAVVKSLAQAHGDHTVTVIGFDPPAAYYRDDFGFLPGFRVDARAADDDYATAMWYEPDGDPTGALAFTVNVIGIVGSSGSWAAWGQRDWEIALVLTQEPQGPWLQQSVPGFGTDVDLDSLRSPTGWGKPLTMEERATFWRHVRERGSGPA